MWLYKIIYYVCGPIIKLFWIRKISGRKNIPLKGGVIIAPNHQSFMDPFLLAATMRKRMFHYLVGEFAYSSKFTRWFLKEVNYIKVDRFNHDKSYVYAKAKEILDDGKVLVVFPEGRLTKDGLIQKGFKGVAKMALASKVDIIPTVIKDSYKIYPIHYKYPKIFGRRCCEIKYLKRIKYSDFKNKDLEYIVHKMIMKEIANELGHKYDHTGFENDIKAEQA
jgi:1-acyl-sn-glycerol-3-phosphate acyltransferase